MGRSLWTCPRPLQAHIAEGEDDDNGLYNRGILVASPSLRAALSPHGSSCTFGHRLENPGASHRQGTKLGRDKLLEGPHVQRDALLTWEPIIIKVTQAGNALPKVRVVGGISGQGQLFLKGSLGNRMEWGKEEGDKKKKQ